MWFDALAPQGVVVVVISSFVAAFLAIAFMSWVSTFRANSSPARAEGGADTAFLFK